MLPRRFFAVVLVLSLARFAAAQPADSRLPVPPPLEVAKAETVVKDLFKAEYARTKLPERAAFAAKLLQQAAETKDDAAGQYVLFREARDLAAKAADASTAFKAADELAATFKVSRGEARAAAADALVAASATQAAQKAAADALLVAAEEQFVAGDWNAAHRLFLAAEAAARKGVFIAQGGYLRGRVKQVEAIRDEAKKVEPQRAALHANPSDPAANEAVGRFTCFVARNWDAGVPLLAKAADPKLRDAAEKDLKALKGVDVDCVAAADAWYDVAARAEPAYKPLIQARAYNWYNLAVTSLTGLARARTEARLKELAAAVVDKTDKALMWAELRTAVAAKRVKKWDIIGGAFEQNTFEEVPPGGILIGFKYTATVDGNFPNVVQPIFMTEDKPEVFGKIYGIGRRGETTQTTKAKPGYAVGAIYTRGGGGFDAFRPIYMRMTAKGLNTADSYEGPMVGGNGGSPGTLGGDGHFIVGIHGKVNRANTSIQALSPVTLAPQVKQP